MYLRPTKGRELIGWETIRQSAPREHRPDELGIRGEIREASIAVISVRDLQAADDEGVARRDPLALQGEDVERERHEGILVIEVGVGAARELAVGAGGQVAPAPGSVQRTVAQE